MAKTSEGVEWRKPFIFLNEFLNKDVYASNATVVDSDMTLMEWWENDFLLHKSDAWTFRETYKEALFLFHLYDSKNNRDESKRGGIKLDFDENDVCELNGKQVRCGGQTYVLYAEIRRDKNAKTLSVKLPYGGSVKKITSENGVGCQCYIDIYIEYL